MHTILLSIGSNTYAENNIRKAKKLLRKQFSEISFSENCQSKPYGEKYKRPFLNLLAIFRSENSIEEVNVLLKEIEKTMGRKTEDKEKGKVVIDIDMIRYDNEILKPKDFERSYIRDLIAFLDIDNK